MSKGSTEERIFKGLMYLSLFIVLGSLGVVFGVVIIKGIGALNFAMLTQTPKGGYYLGKEGGILNAILGSVYLSLGAICLATIISLPTAWYLNHCPKDSLFAKYIRWSLELAGGFPSLIYGAFVFLIMLQFHERASLLWGIVTVSLFLVPLLTRAIDEVMKMVPSRLKDASTALGASMNQTLFFVVTRQALPGILTAVLIAFGRGIGDAASVLFTAGFTDSIPGSLADPVATLPLAIFFQISSPLPSVQERAYASAIVLLTIVLVISIMSRILARKYMKYVIK